MGLADDIRQRQKRIQETLRQLNKLSKRTPEDRYREHREAARERQASLAASGRDIGSIPPIANPERRDRGRGSLADGGRSHD